MNGAAIDRYGGAALAPEVSNERGVRYKAKQKMCAVTVKQVETGLTGAPRVP